MGADGGRLIIPAPNPHEIFRDHLRATQRKISFPQVGTHQKALRFLSPLRRSAHVRAKSGRSSFHGRSGPFGARRGTVTNARKRLEKCKRWHFGSYFWTPDAKFDARVFGTDPCRAGRVQPATATLSQTSICVTPYLQPHLLEGCGNQTIEHCIRLRGIVHATTSRPPTRSE